MKEKFGAEVRGFRYAFVLPNHDEGWDSHALVPAQPAPAAGNDGPGPRRRATDRKPTYIEIKPKL
jgi:hypothetical protein